MFFDSPVYIVFLIIVVVAYWRLRRREQNVFLLCASYFFYGWWDWRFLLLMIASTSVDFVIARQLPQVTDSTRRRFLLVFSILINFSILGFFKYFNFFTASFASLLTSIGIHGVPMSVLRIILPPGISFYTFQEVAYIVDVYKGKIKPAQSFVDYALFISLFPHLIAGPIQQPGHLLPQVQRDREFDGNRVFDGLLLILFGLLQKCIIADNCALIANAAFNGRFGQTTMPVVLLGAYAFAWQIYGDFAGYSNVARGSAQLLGFHFMVNFRQPYLATSIQDFWRRWHISLSGWLRDYLYIPLGGSRGGETRTYGNLLTTMLLGGLWHGANWTFVIWGAIHGASLAIERILGLKTDESGTETWFARWIKRILLFNFVCVTWVFFRATSLWAAVQFLGGLGRFSWEANYLTALQFLAVFAVTMFLMDLRMEWAGEEYPFQRISPLARVGVGAAALLAIAILGANQTNAFIYFQF